jgi:hypothetical protein
MYPAFDIFKTDFTGGVLWCSQASTLDEAKATVKKLCAEGSASEFIILNQDTQERTIIKPSKSATSGN